MAAPRPALSTGAYLNGITLSRPLYALLFKEAMGVLPPARDGAPREAIACGLALRTLAKRLERSPSTVREDMRRLVAYGWVRGERPWMLGYRTGHRLGLLADMAAEEATGEPYLVAQVVLGLSTPERRSGSPGGASEGPSVSRPATRGTLRRWQP